MANHGVVIPLSVAALNIDSYNRSAVCASDIDNGMVLVLADKSVTAGQAEVWTGIVPSTGNGLTGLWMAYEPEIVLTASGSSYYKGLDPNPQNFYSLATKVFSVFYPRIGDVLLMTAECFLNTVSTFVNATDTSGGFNLYWGGSKTASVLSMKLQATSYISLATGAINTQRITAYQMEVVGV